MTGIRPSLIAASRRRVSFDPDAADYFARIVSAGSSISSANKTAVDAFVKGCKTDGIWSAIKACCLLAGPDDLTGALVTLVGTAPTSVNFVSADYNRTTGLVGNGSTKYLNTNRNNNADPQNSKHLSVYITSLSTVLNTTLIGQGLATGSSHLTVNNVTSPVSYAARVNGPGVANIGALTTGFAGLNRSASTGFVIRSNNSTSTEIASTSATPANGNIFVFNGINYYNGGISFYSIGESLDLALLDARISTYMASIT
jgi:hypothetical protein